MDTMIVMYNLKPGQSEGEFEQWLRDIDIPGYAGMRSMRNPSYYRAAGLLNDDKPAPFKYTVVIEMDGPQAVEAEMGDPRWSDFIADFESRVADATYVTATKIA